MAVRCLKILGCRSCKQGGKRKKNEEDGMLDFFLGGGGGGKEGNVNLRLALTLPAAK
jgi:hypothetical protein